MRYILLVIVAVLLIGVFSAILIGKIFSKKKSSPFSIQTLTADFHESYSEDELKFMDSLLLSGRFLHNDKNEVIFKGQFHFCADDTMLDGAIASLKEKTKGNISADTVQNLLAELVGTLYDNGNRKLQVVLYHNGETHVYNLPDLRRVINVVNGICMVHTVHALQNANMFHSSIEGKSGTPFYDRIKGQKVFMTWQPPQHDFAKGDTFGFHTLELDTPPAKHGAIPVFFKYESAKKYLEGIKDPRVQVAIVGLVELVKFVKGQFTVVVEPFTNYWVELDWPDQNK